MKKILVAVLASLAIGASAQGAFDSPGGLELRFGGVSLTEDYWDDDVIGGLDFGFVFWGQGGTLGCWIGCGVEGATLDWYDGYGNHETDFTAVPFGASLLLRGELNPAVAIRAEAGARYVALDIDDDPGYYDHHGHFHYNHGYDRASRRLDVDDTAFAIASLQLEFNVRPFVLGLGGGYQFDLCKPDIEYDHEKFDEIDLSGAFFFINLGIAF